MSLPVRTHPGPLGPPAAFAGNGSAELRDFRPAPGHHRSFFTLRVTQPGNLSVFVVRNAAEDLLSGPTALAANGNPATQAAHTVLIDGPIAGDVRFRFTNTNATAGTIVGAGASGGVGLAAAP